MSDTEIQAYLANLPERPELSAPRGTKAVLRADVAAAADPEAIESWLARHAGELDAKAAGQLPAPGGRVRYVNGPTQYWVIARQALDE
jgi:hypothetical protein